MLRTIKGKFIIGFFLIFSLSFLVLNQTVKSVIWSSNEKIVTSDLIDFKKNSIMYINQAFLINHYKNNELYFGDMADEIVDSLTHSTGSNVGVYTVDGTLLSSSNKTVFSQGIDEDLAKAINGKNAYHITYDRNQAQVFFSYPVVIDGAKVGILRFSKDFNLLYKQSGEILNIIFYIALAIFVAAFLFSYILSRHITIPIVKLTEATSEVKKGKLDVDIHFSRKDEIGQLTVNFNDMITRIRDQISTIEKDRDRLKELNEQEKRFFDNMTHELKTPLTSIQGYAEIIKQKGESDQAFFDKGMNHIVEESRRLHNLVIKLLEVSRETSKEQFDRIDAGTILKDVCESMKFRAERYKKKITYEIEDSLYVYGQKNRVRQLFINLLDNAIKYSLSHSEIMIQAKVTGDQVLFMFKNPSDPYDDNQYTKVFQPFYSINQKVTEEGSLGLGLSIVKTIVEKHGGTIKMFYEENHTIITIELAYMKVEK
ncbi:HAMP domain-containing sensor histidine kinase [Bacillus subtilis]|uniref:HAMP domain-containing sensor histidine kinase n=1 Tax=Bacillus subtilis TaxID=1423 RepID=UPI002DBB8CF1|nr:HAMP domain-containing sensor histidine kinase [Bacillus subtilis]MEC3621158.1 HAMP domain-containing sensor histidine kinase [Bacillus subtilis]MEC3636587.1 HAMP domain-containing sensor histidine kinase [Bacillus subtilis]MEC3641545.1 HAMP domain-containing sensor histidine kinase [Bacillus subtilis]MEC3648244.1 HAMP domain-containing sensor histidine kinase [Bacillus subtilis]MEC3698698.1 HAMP domain-containing sensor histidine kinase [Bacillus subtilis]